MPKVSVVVPVYGVEKYIERCARSLFEQTLDDMEFIFVDDCTPDRSMDILQRVIDEYRPRLAEKNDAVKIERMLVNSGQAVVRKRGIELCTGDYIIHCDSDDWVQVNMYQKMYDEAKRTNADVVICDYSVTDGLYSSTTVSACHSTSVMSFVENCLFQKDSWSLCNKLFRIEVYYNNITYPIGDMGEDMVIVLQLMVNCKTLSYLPVALYNYFYNHNSITKTSSREAVVRKYEQLVSNADIVIDYFTDNGISTTMKQGMIAYKNFIRSVLYPIVWDKRYYHIWNDMFPGLNRQVMFSPKISITNKCRVFLTIIHLYPITMIH